MVYDGVWCSNGSTVSGRETVSKQVAARKEMQGNGKCSAENQ